MTRSERLANILELAFRARHGGTALPLDWNHRLTAAAVDIVDLSRVLSRLDELSREWSALRIGDSLVLSWPRPERRASKRQRAGLPINSA